MKVFGLLVVLAGVVTFVPAQFEMQSRMMQPIAAYQPWGGIAAVAVGALFLWAAPKGAPAKKK